MNPRQGLRAGWKGDNPVNRQGEVRRGHGFDETVTIVVTAEGVDVACDLSFEHELRRRTRWQPGQPRCLGRTAHGGEAL